jgi:hypothetical protein
MRTSIELNSDETPVPLSSSLYLVIVPTELSQLPKKKAYQSKSTAITDIPLLTFLQVLQQKQ